jgi:hypothetical protein
MYSLPYGSPHRRTNNEGKKKEYGYLDMRESSMVAATRGNWTY